MELPDVPVPQEYVLNEYFQRLANLSAANIRLTALVHAVVDQRDAAVRRVTELEAEIRGWKSAETEVVHLGNPPRIRPEAS